MVPVIGTQTAARRPRCCPQHLLVNIEPHNELRAYGVIQCAGARAAHANESGEQTQ